MLHNCTPERYGHFYNASWMRRLASSQTLASTPAVCQRWFRTNSTSSTFPNAWSTSWLSWSAGVWYLVNCCTPVADVASRHRRSANLHRWIVLRYRRSMHARSAGLLCRLPTVWNSLPVELREPAVSNGIFWRTLKTILFSRYQCIERNWDRCVAWNCTI